MDGGALVRSYPQNWPVTFRIPKALIVRDGDRCSGWRADTPGGSREAQTGMLFRDAQKMKETNEPVGYPL